MQITTNRAKPGKQLPYRKRQTVSVRGTVVWVRVLDGAGNQSRWRKVRIR